MKVRLAYLWVCVLAHWTVKVVCSVVLGKLQTVHWDKYHELKIKVNLMNIKW